MGSWWAAPLLLLALAPAASATLAVASFEVDPAPIAPSTGFGLVVYTISLDCISAVQRAPPMLESGFEVYVQWSAPPGVQVVGAPSVPMDSQPCAAGATQIMGQGDAQVLVDRSLRALA